MEKRTVLIPRYMHEFSCIGSACEDTCCSGWQITIDKKTYNKYEEAHAREEKHSMIQHLKKIEFNPSKENFAEIIQTADSMCPLLNEEKLCSVHLQMGEQYLSNLCVTYPRVSNVVDGMYERSATVSCPEAARLALLNPEGIRFDELDESMDERHLVVMRVDTQEQRPDRLQQLYFLELRSFTIQLLQNRTYSLSERLIILGMFFEKLKEYLVSEGSGEIPTLISSYTRQIKDRTVRECIPDFPISLRAQLQTVRKLMDMRLFAGVKDKRYLQCLMETLEGIQYSSDFLTEESIELYRDAHQDLFLPFIAEHEYILENYLVNYTFKNLFPIKRDVFEEYIVLVVHFALIKMHLIGMMGYHRKAFSVEHVIKLIQSFSRTVEHAPNELRRFLNYLNENGYCTLSFMASLIKN